VSKYYHYILISIIFWPVHAADRAREKRLSKGREGLTHLFGCPCARYEPISMKGKK